VRATQILNARHFKEQLKRLFQLFNSSTFQLLPLEYSTDVRWVLNRGKRCVLEFHSVKYVITVRKEFRRKFVKDPPTANSVKKLYEKVVDTGCICRRMSSDRRRTSAETVGGVRQTYQRSQHVRRAASWTYHSQVSGKLFETALLSGLTDNKCCST
jgi:hypothetical protein